MNEKLLKLWLLKSQSQLDFQVDENDLRTVMYGSTVCTLCVVVWQLCVARGPHKGTQTETSLFDTSCSANGTSSLQPDGILPECSCDAKMVFNELKGQLKEEHDADKGSALKSLEERVRTCCFCWFLSVYRVFLAQLLQHLFRITTDNFVRRWCASFLRYNFNT